MTNTKPTRIKTIAEFHRLRGLPKPEHPLISVVNIETVDSSDSNGSASLILDFYSISIKRCLLTKFKYGQQEYDFDGFCSSILIFCGIPLWQKLLRNTNTSTIRYMKPCFFQIKKRQP